VAAIVPRLIAAGLQPSLLEYIDILTMAGICGANNLELGVASDIAEKTLAYLVLIVETRTREQLELDIAAAAAMLDEAGALDIYVLESGVATRLIEAREKAFWLAKGNGANEIIDIVVPRSSVPDFLDHVRQLAERHATFVSGCGHIGDGNVHLSVFQSDDEIRQRFLLELFESGLATGGAISGEHGIGRDKCDAYLALSDPHVIALQRRIKQAFDPGNLLNPGLWHGAVS
jgi:glycolate oxidase